VIDTSTAGTSHVAWRRAVVLSLGRRWSGAVELRVRIDDRPVKALALPHLVGEPQVGDVVLVTTGALDQDLGTGGYAMVVALPDRLPPAAPAPGHLVKARYTPLQVLVQGADEQGSPHHELLREADDLSGVPVVVADLHSALPAIVVGIRTVWPQARVAYVMTDGGALPAWFSRTLDHLRTLEWLVGSVTTGQSFGGDHEAVTVHTGLLTARLVLAADVIVVAQGPGNLGTGTKWGFSGVSAGEACNAAAALGGRPIGSLRVSQADARPRHQGVSHHTLTTYSRVALAAMDIVVPLLPGPFGKLIVSQASTLGRPQTPHRLVQIATEGLRNALSGCPVPLSTMGRDLDADPAAFVAAAAAGVHAARLVTPAGD
jgi:hypothetical protein